MQPPLSKTTPKSATLPPIFSGTKTKTETSEPPHPLQVTAAAAVLRSPTAGGDVAPLALSAVKSYVGHTEGAAGAAALAHALLALRSLRTPEYEILCRTRANRVDQRARVGADGLIGLACARLPRAKGQSHNDVAARRERSWTESLAGADRSPCDQRCFTSEALIRTSRARWTRGGPSAGRATGFPNTDPLVVRRSSCPGARRARPLGIPKRARGSRARRA
eukprot:1195441-Prorocentrum_minimum.AAC.5